VDTMESCIRGSKGLSKFAVNLENVWPSRRSIVGVPAGRLVL
jgi:hypothetical protein